MKKAAFMMLALFSMFLVRSAMAQDMSAEKPEIVKRVMTMVGNWQANMTQTMGNQSTQVTDKINFQSTAGDHGLLGMETMETPNHKQYFATHLVGWDPMTKQLHWYIVDNMGTTNDSQGELVDPNHVRLTNTSNMEGKTSKTEVNLVWQNDDWIKFNLVQTVNGAVKESMQGDFKRSEGMH